MILIDNKKLIPAPFISFNKECNFTPDGRPLNSNYRISLQGTLLPERGSPTSSGFATGVADPANEVFNTDVEQHDALLAKQELLREALTTPGFKLSYFPSGLTRIETYPVLRSISFEPGTWTTLSRYSVELDAKTFNRSGTVAYEDIIPLSASGLFLSSVSDTWNIKERDDGSDIIEVSRNVSAVGFTNYISGAILGQEAWRNAKTWVSGRLSSVGMEINYFNLPTGVSPTGKYNLITEEAIDKVGGSYSVAQRFIMSNRTYIEQVNVQRTTEYPLDQDNGPTVERIVVNGNIQGLDPDNIPANKLSAAQTYWAFRESLLPAQVGAYGNPVNKNYTENQVLGTIDYSVNFINNSGTIYKHNYDVSFSFNNDTPTVTINGTIQGITNDSFFQTNNARFANAVSGFQIIQPQLRDLAFAYGGTLFGSTSSSGSYSSVPINKSISYNKPLGSINYTYGFNFLTTGSVDKAYLDTYTVDLSSQNNTATTAGYGCTVTINGTLQGMATDDNPDTRFANAETGWSTVQGLLFARASGEYSKLGGTTPNLNNRVVTKSVTVNRPGGSIGYSYTFNNTLAPTNSGVAVADVTIEETWPQDVIAIQIIPGRSSGPIIQNIGTKTEYRRAINVTLTMYPKAGGYWGFTDRGTPRTIASGYIASGVLDLGVNGSGWFLTGKSENWDWKNGLFSTSVNVVATGIGA
jgi:hypothetical protein